jgi:hypothetical protein
MSRRGLLVVVALAFVLGAGIDALIGYSTFAGYGATIGVVGTIAIVLVSAGVTRLLARPEAYYPDEAPPDVEPDLLGPPAGRGDRDG